MIGYNAQCYKHGSVSGSAQSSECRFEFSSWWYDTLNNLIKLVWLYHISKQVLFSYFLSFGSCIQNPLCSKFWGGTYDASAPQASLTLEILLRDVKLFGFMKKLFNFAMSVHILHINLSRSFFSATLFLQCWQQKVRRILYFDNVKMFCILTKMILKMCSFAYKLG